MSDIPPLPRVTIQFCTQCKWMLRAAYFAQELLSTFSTSLGEVALQPSTGGTFIVNLYTAAPPVTGEENGEVRTTKHLLWDRKAEGGFPETKELKRRVRDVIDPNRDLGHVDGKKSTPSQPPPTPAPTNPSSSSTPPIPNTAKKPTLKQPPISRALNRLQQQNPSFAPAEAERKFTPMDIDTRPLSSAGPSTSNLQEQQSEPEKEVLNSRGKIQIGGGSSREEGFGYCRPGEDCEDCG